MVSFFGHNKKEFRKWKIDFWVSLCWILMLSVLSCSQIEAKTDRLEKRKTVKTANLSILLRKGKNCRYRAMMHKPWLNLRRRRGSRIYEFVRHPRFQVWHHISKATFSLSALFVGFVLRSCPYIPAFFPWQPYAWVIFLAGHIKKCLRVLLKVESSDVKSFPKWFFNPPPQFPRSLLTRDINFYCGCLQHFSFAPFKMWE